VIHPRHRIEEPPTELSDEQLESIERWAETPQARHLMEGLSRSIDQLSVSEQTQALWANAAGPPTEERT